MKETSTINKITIENIDSKGLLMDWSQEFSVKAIISITKKDGLQVWYEHVADCGHCISYASCRAYLLRSAKEHGTKLTEDLLRSVCVVC